MNRKEERTAGARERATAEEFRDPRLDALDRHAEERDRLFNAALISQDTDEREVGRAGVARRVPRRDRAT